MRLCVCDYMVLGSWRPLQPHGGRGPHMSAHSQSEVIGGVTAPGNETHLKLQLNNIN